MIVEPDDVPCAFREKPAAVFGLVVAVTAALGMLGACTPVQRQPANKPVEVSYRVVRDFRATADGLLQDKPDLETSCALARKLIEMSPLSGVYRHGAGFEESYYASFLQGLVLLRCDNKRKLAREAFELERSRGRIQDDEDWGRQFATVWAEVDDTTPPAVRIDRVDYVRWAAHRNDKGEVDVEHVQIRLEGVVSDDSGVTSVKIQGVEVPIKDSGEGHTGKYEYRLEAPEIPVDIVANEGTIRVVAVDSNANIRDEELPLPQLPDLRLNDPESIYAIVVGVDRYDGAYLDAGGKCLEEYRRECANYATAKCYKLKTLTYAASDAEDFAELLTARGVPRDHVMTLLSNGSSTGARRADVIAALQQAKNWRGKKLLFFFAGHGYFSPREENLMLLSDTIAVDCERSSDGRRSFLDESSISVAQVKGLMNETEFGDKYIFLDACRTGRDGERAIDGELSLGIRASRQVEDEPPPDPRQREVRRGVITFYASQREDISTESNVLKGGYFSHFLTLGLRLNKSLYDLNTYVFDHVEEYSAKELCGMSPDAAKESCAQQPYLSLPPHESDSRDLDQNLDMQRRTYVLGP